MKRTPFALSLMVGLVLFCAFKPVARAAKIPWGLSISWTNNFLHIAGKGIPGGPIDVLWWEAFCKSGSTARVWNETTIPHKTKLVSASSSGKSLRLKTEVQPGVEVNQTITAHQDYVEIRCVFRNKSKQAVDLEWFEPCMRVDRFTGLKQTNYFSKCFIYTRAGASRLDRLPRNEEALYRGGQVYVPEGIPLKDVNPRPISFVTPVNNLMGCVSSDGQWVLGTTWEKVQHLFQGVAVCVHADPHLGGLKAGERKAVKGRIYLFKGTPEQLEKRYRRDFGGK